jgi:hypothetical protein
MAEDGKRKRNASADNDSIDCDCPTCIHNVRPSPSPVQLSWPQEVPLDVHKVADFFTIDPKIRDQFMSWVAQKIRLPLPTPILLKTREIGGRVRTDQVQGTIIHLFRDFVNEREDLFYGLLFKGSPVYNHCVRQLIHFRRVHLDSVEPIEPYKCYYEDEVVV